MANNCYNDIQIHGSKEDIRAFKALFTSHNAPIEEGLYFRLLGNFNSNIDDNAKWFEMRLEKVDECKCVVYGDSAWVPSLDLFTKISERFKSLVIHYEYEEMGCDFAGWADISDGSCSDNCYRYWEGMREMRGEKELINMIIENEIEYYDEEELIESDMFNVLSEEGKQIILKLL
jgi:hypothetical protein